jgi:tetratricopeptide (TPR) repeat protein
MKRCVLIVLLVIAAATTRAQVTGPDTAFRFVFRISRSVNHWIVFPKQAASDIYPFGYLYIDPKQGFIFNLEGFFIANPSGTFTRIKQKIDEATRQKYRLKPGDKTLIAHIDPEHNVELDIYPRPSWLAIYNDYSDTTAHCVDWARAYNGIKDNEMAIQILQAPYHTDPHADDLEFELSHAYNELQRFNDAIKVCDAALLHDVGNAPIYKELGNAQLGVGKVDEAISTYSAGIQLCDASQNQEKSEMAMNIAIAFQTKGNTDKYKQWLAYARAWAPENSNIARKLEDM